ncbi:MAG TPA: aminotransferase class V-fold PLP-dependent enzyme [Mycobacteriales bacterium]|nr:aminotransferase class V-fold PLP-dependent enzyme [Mycobacteriales bacterium]
MHEDLLELRRNYPILDTKRGYLINNSLGAMPAAVHDRLREYADLWATRGVVAWRDWIPEMTRVADLVGAVIGAPPGTTVMHQNVATLIGAVASALDFSGQRNRIVYSVLDFPSCHYVWSAQARYGGEVVLVPSDDGMTVDPQRMVDAIDERTLIVPISHVLFKSSSIFDFAPVVERAREVGALVLLDAYQSAGAVPLDVVAADVDFCVGGSVKWLCGGPAAGWLYGKPAVVEALRPTQVGWFGHAAPFEFVFDSIDYAPGIGRFAGGTPGVPAAYAAAPGYQAVLDVGVDRIRERSMSLTQPLLEGALERGFAVRSPVDPTTRGGAVTIDPGDAEKVHHELLARDFVVDHRPGAGIRVAPHFYNTAEECTAVLDEMAAIRSGR